MTFRMGDYPYLLHTNRELELMLAGKKPFAVFAHEQVEGFEKADALSGQDFGPHVASGRLSEHSRSFQALAPDGTQVQVDYYFYALPGEEWRVEAYCLLLDLRYGQVGSRCPQLEWIEGRLLGYTDEQNAYHLSRMYPKAWDEA